jgi:hypothetical protein
MLTATERSFRSNEPLYYICIFFVLLALSFISLPISDHQNLAVSVVSGILFLNSTHIVLTAALYFEIFHSQKIKVFRSERFWLGLFFIFAAVMGFMWFSFFFDSTYLKVAFAILYFSASRHHGISQTYGLLLQENKSRQVRFEFSRVDMIVAWIAPTAIFVSLTYDLQSYWYLMAGSFVYQLKVVYRFFKEKDFSKLSLSFLARYLIYINSGANYWFLVGCSFVHGIEYLGGYVHLSDRAGVAVKKRMKVYSLLLFLAPIFLLIHYQSFLAIVWPGLLMNSSVFYSMIVFGKLCSFTHFYFDAHMFRFKDREVRSVLTKVFKSA